MPKHKMVSETTHTDCTIIPIFEEEQLAPQVSIMNEKIRESTVSLFASKDFEGKQTRNIRIQFERNTPEDNTNPNDQKHDEWF